jgi:ureidoacrylate peracid hydrolase
MQSSILRFISFGLLGSQLYVALSATLKRLGVKYLIIAGVTTSICVESTVRDAMFRDCLCVTVRDCMNEPIGDLPRTNHKTSLLNPEALLGWVSDSEQLSTRSQ